MNYAKILMLYMKRFIFMMLHLNDELATCVCLKLVFLVKFGKVKFF